MNEPKYGVFITIQFWATVNGGHDRVGSEADMKALVKRWETENADYGAYGEKYEVIPYTGKDEHVDATHGPDLSEGLGRCRTLKDPMRLPGWTKRVATSSSDVTGVTMESNV